MQRLLNSKKDTPWPRRCGGRGISKTIFEGCDCVIAFDEYKLGLDGMEKDITELRDSL